MFADPLAVLRARLPRHAALLDSKGSLAATADRWRWLQYGCSLRAGGGDELSDGLAATYAVPDDAAAVRAAANAAADLLESAVTLADQALGADLASPVGPVVRRRLR